MSDQKMSNQKMPSQKMSNPEMSNQFVQQLVRIRYFFGLFFYSLLAVFKEFCYASRRKLLNEPLFGTTTNLHRDLSGCVCLISGAANGSLGRAIISKLVKRKCYLIITVHGDQAYAEKAKNNLIQNELKDVDSSLYRFERLDMVSFDSIIRLVKKLNDSSQKINFLISNPGKTVHFCLIKMF